MKVFQRTRSNVESQHTIARSQKNLLMTKMKDISHLNQLSKAFKRRLESRRNPIRMRHKEEVRALKAGEEQEAEAEVIEVLEIVVQVK